LLAVGRQPIRYLALSSNGEETPGCSRVPNHDPDAADFAKDGFMSEHHSSSICCFLRVHFYSKIDYTFTLSDQYAWLATKCPYSRVPKKKIDQQAARKQ
jgi:hypothetical protein